MEHLFLQKYCKMCKCIFAENENRDTYVSNITSDAI